MANHRAGKRELTRLDSSDRTAVRRSTGGKRKAVKPSRATRNEPDVALRESAETLTLRPAAAPEPTPPTVPAAPVLAPRITVAEPVSPVRSRTTTRRNVSLLPSAPTLVGAAAIVAAAAGAVTVGQGSSTDVASGNIQRLSAQASAMSGDSAVSSTATQSSRALAVSRDTQREALRDAAAQDLQAAAEAQAQERNAALAALAASAEKHATALAANAWQLPIAPGAYHLTATFGEVGLWASVHTGLDFAAPTGTPIMSIARGVVTEVGYAGAYGNRTIVTLDDGTELWYCHQNAFNVSVGEHVSPGQLIGYVGSTGHVTGPHLHLEVRPGAGDPVDPYTALVVHGLHP